MPRKCSICLHPKRAEIERAMIDSEAYRSIALRFSASESAVYRHLKDHLPGVIAKGIALASDGAAPPKSKRSAATAKGVKPPGEPPAGTKPSPVKPQEPLGCAVAPEQAFEAARHRAGIEARQDQMAIDAVQQLRAINAACLEVLREARTNGQPLILLRAVDRIAKQIELQARLLGQIQDGATVNVTVLPEWQGIRRLVLDALSSYPAARLSVAEALQQAGF